MIKYFVVTIFVLGCIAGRAHADMPPYPRIAEVLQEGENVRITLGTSGRFYEAQSIDAPVTITRIQADKQTVVDDQIIMTEAYADNIIHSCMPMRYDANGGPNFVGVETADLCDRYPESCHRCAEAETAICIGADCKNCDVVADRVYPDLLTQTSDFCDAFPDFMVDCDQDGTDDCCVQCAPPHYNFVVVDECVPPGETVYEISGESVWPGNESKASISVAAAEGECTTANSDDLATDDATNDEPTTNEQTDAPTDMVDSGERDLDVQDDSLNEQVENISADGQDENVGCQIAHPGNMSESSRPWHLISALL